MKRANVAELKSRLSHYLTLVEKGDQIYVCRRNVPVAILTPVSTKRLNQTVLGSDRGSATVVGDLTEPAIPESDWDMLRVAEE